MMLKSMWIAVCAILLNGCPFVPPSPYHTTVLGNLPPGHIAISPGQYVTESITKDLPAHVDIIEVSSELDVDLLTAIFHLRELPKKPRFSQEPGHFRDEKYQWIVLVDVEGDSSTPFSHPDYWFQATYYDPETARIAFGRIIPAEPYVTTTLFENGRAVAPHNEMEYTTHEYLEGEVRMTFSPEDGTLALSARIPGVTGASTIAFIAHDFRTPNPDYAPRDAD